MRHLLALLFLVPGLALAQNTVEVTGNICTQTWTNTNTYVLVSRVFVTDGCTLMIEPGTVVRGRFNSDPTQAAALVITRGARILADGTRQQPIIFTAEEDDLSIPDDLLFTDRGLWGGVIVLGRAVINVGGGEENIEGISADDPRGIYGCDRGSGSGVACNDDDDSGVIRYVSIRHGGARISADNEINGLTMGGVGRGTTVEYVEVFANEDDGFEWFGGTVDTKYLVAAFVGDDMFDWDEGFRGRGQFWFGIHADDDAGSGGEHDGGTTPEDGEPYAIPVVYNATYLGSGAGANLPSNDFGLNIRDNSGGKYYNSIFSDFSGRAVAIENLSSGQDSWQRFLDGDLVLSDNIFGTFGGGSTLAELFIVSGSGAAAADQTELRDYIAASNRLADPLLTAVDRGDNGLLDPRPAAGSPARTGAVQPPSDGFFSPVNYLGAFAPDTPTWLSEWTFLDQGGYLSDLAVPNEEGTAVAGFGLGTVYPNPVRGTATVAFELDRAQAATVAVYDLLGREVAVLARGEQPAGRTTVSLDAAAFPAGLYVVRLAGETATATQKVVVVR